MFIELTNIKSSKKHIISEQINLLSVDDQNDKIKLYQKRNSLIFEEYYQYGNEVRKTRPLGLFAIMLLP